MRAEPSLPNLVGTSAAVQEPQAGRERTPTRAGGPSNPPSCLAEAPVASGECFEGAACPLRRAPARESPSRARLFSFSPLGRAGPHRSRPSGQVASERPRCPRLGRSRRRRRAMSPAAGGGGRGGFPLPSRPDAAARLLGGHRVENCGSSSPSEWSYSDPMLEVGALPSVTDVMASAAAGTPRSPPLSPLHPPPTPFLLPTAAAASPTPRTRSSAPTSSFRLASLRRPSTRFMRSSQASVSGSGRSPWRKLSSATLTCACS